MDRSITISSLHGIRTTVAKVVATSQHDLAITLPASSQLRLSLNLVIELNVLLRFNVVVTEVVVVVGAHNSIDLRPLAWTGQCQTLSRFLSSKRTSTWGF